MQLPSTPLILLAFLSTPISALPTTNPNPLLTPRGTRFSSLASSSTGSYIYKQLYNRQGQAIYNLPAAQKAQLFQNVRDEITAQPNWETAIAPPEWVASVKPDDEMPGVFQFQFARTGRSVKPPQTVVYTLGDLMNAIDQMEAGGPDITRSDESGTDAQKLPVTRVQAYSVDGKHAANIRFDVF